MIDGIRIEGLEEIESFLQEVTISEEDERRAIRASLKPMAQEIENNTTKKSGKLSKLTTTVKKEGLGTVGTIKTKRFYDIFEEFGASGKKHNIGYFERSVRNKEAESISILAKLLLDKIK